MGCDCHGEFENIARRIEDVQGQIEFSVAKDGSIDETLYGKTLQKADGKDDTAKHGALGSLRFCNWAAPEYGPVGEGFWNNAFRAAALAIAIANGVAQSQIADMQQDLADW